MPRLAQAVLAGLVLVVGIVLSPLRAVAATVPVLIDYDAAVLSTSTTVLGGYEAVRSAERPPFNDYDCTHVGYGDPSNPPLVAGAGGVHAYDDTLELLEQRELAKGAIYGFVEATAAAEGLPAAESWGSAATLERHFADHGADFASTSAEEYAEQASEFFQRAQTEGLPTKIDPNGVIRVYDPSTNTFGAFNPDGTTRTFFTPSSPTYWLRQPGVEPWSPGGGH